MIIFKIKEIRESKNITIYKLAQETNMSLSYLTELENNKKNNPTIQTLYRIALVLDVNIKDLFTTEFDS